jgi:hypothetical protein
VGLAPRDAAWPSILREDDPALVDEMYDDVEAFRRRIRTLLRDPEEHAATSRSLHERVDRIHGADAWVSAMERVQDALAHALGERNQQPPQPAQLGMPGAEDAIVATYLADCEDHLIREELRLTAMRDGDDGSHGNPVATGLERIDALLLGPGGASTDAYDEALSVARSMNPRRLRLRR